MGVSMLVFKEDKYDFYLSYKDKGLMFKSIREQDISLCKVTRYIDDNFDNLDDCVMRADLNDCGKYENIEYEDVVLYSCKDKIYKHYKKGDAVCTCVED